MMVRRRRRAVPALLTMLLATSILAACGGSGGGTKVAPTLAPSATSAPQTPTAAAMATLPATMAAGASPVGGVSGQTMTRAEYQDLIRRSFDWSEPANRGGTLVIGEAGDISTLNAILANDSTTFNIVGAIFEPLLGVSPIDGQPVPALADSWEVSPDGLVYTFRINQQAKWHDGVDVTAEDVKFSFDAVLDPNTGSSYSTIVNDAVDSYRVIDPDTFEIVAKDRFVTFYYEVPATVLIMPKHIWEGVGFESWSFDPGSTGQDPARVVGSGPFKFKEWRLGEYVSIVRNDDYYDVVPVIDELIMRVLPDADTATLSLESGEIDVMQIIPAGQTQRIQETPGRRVDIYSIPAITFYGMNLDSNRSTLFIDQRVRQALLMGLDRDAMTAAIFLGFGEAAIGTQPPLSPAYAPDRINPALAFDQETARSLLAEAGWVDSDNNGVLENNGVEFEFSLIYSAGDATVEQIVAYMQEQWKALGVKVNLEGMGGDAWLDKLTNRDFDMALVGFNLGPDGSQGPLFTCGADFNFWGYCEPAYDQLDAQQKREFDPDARRELLIQQSQMIWEAQAIGPLRFGVARTGYSDRIHNFYPNGYGFLWSLPYIWLDPVS